MAITRVAHGTLGTGTNPVPGEPAGIQSGDLLLLLTKTSGSIGTTPPTAGAEWRLEMVPRGTGAAGSATEGKVYSFQYRGTSPSYAVTGSSAPWALVVAYRPTSGKYIVVDPSAGFIGTVGASSATVNYPDLTPVTVDEMRFWIWYSGSVTNGAISGTNPTATTQLDSNSGYADGFLNATTPTGARTSTISGPTFQVGATLLMREQTSPAEGAFGAIMMPDLISFI